MTEKYQSSDKETCLACFRCLVDQGKVRKVV